MRRTAGDHVRLYLTVLCLLAVLGLASCNDDASADDASAPVLYVVFESGTEMEGPEQRLVTLYRLAAVTAEGERLAEVPIAGAGRLLRDVRLLPRAGGVVVNTGRSLDLYSFREGGFRQTALFEAREGTSLYGLAVNGAENTAATAIVPDACAGRVRCPDGMVALVDLDEGAIGRQPATVTVTDGGAIPAPELWLDDDRLLIRWFAPSGGGGSSLATLHMRDHSSSTLTREGTQPAFPGSVSPNGEWYADHPVAPVDYCQRAAVTEIDVRSIASGAVAGRIESPGGPLQVWEWSPDSTSMLVQVFAPPSELPFEDCSRPPQWLVVSLGADDGQQAVDPVAVRREWYGERTVLFRCGQELMIGHHTSDGRLLAPPCSAPDGGAVDVAVEYQGRDVFRGRGITTWMPAATE